MTKTIAHVGIGDSWMQPLKLVGKEARDALCKAKPNDKGNVVVEVEARVVFTLGPQGIGYSVIAEVKGE